MREEIVCALNELQDNRGVLWLNSVEFGRIALNGGFELTVRDRLLEPLHREFNRRNKTYSIVSEYSRHGMGGNLRADIALLDGPLNSPKDPQCKTIFELKTNFCSQIADIKSRTKHDFDKWFKAEIPMVFDYCYMHLIVEIISSENSGFFPKYKKKNSVHIGEVSDFFNGFSENNDCSLIQNISTPYSTECKYPCYEPPFKISTYYFILEKNSA